MDRTKRQVEEYRRFHELVQCVRGSQTRLATPALRRFHCFLVASRSTVALLIARMASYSSSIVVFEDSAMGVEAAVRAGMRVVGVATHEKRLANVDLMIRDFRDEGLVEWLRGLAHLRRE